jgi:hypothetical protein
MKLISFLVVLLFLPILIYANSHEDMQLKVSIERCATSSLKDLEELGYCIIPQVLSSAETEVLYNRVWHEFIEKAWPNCTLDDRSNWKESFPIHQRGHRPQGVETRSENQK